MISKEKLSELQQSRKHGIGRLLLLARRDFAKRLARRMSEQGDPRLLSASRSAILPYIDLEGTRSTEVARRMGISKQAVATAVKALEEEGLLARMPDAADGRAFLITFTEEGVEFLLRIHANILAIENEYQQIAGTTGMQALRNVLNDIVYGQEDESSSVRSEGR